MMSQSTTMSTTPTTASHRDPESNPTSSPKRKMRRGTHSCIECRRRKIRCIWPVHAASCVQCSSRGVSCVEQASVLNAQTLALRRKKKKMGDRIGELETTIAQLLQRLDTLGINSADVVEGGTDLERAASESLGLSEVSEQETGSSFPDSFLRGQGLGDVLGEQEHAPVLSLFENDVLTSAGVVPTNKGPLLQVSSYGTSGGLEGRYRRILKRLGTMTLSADTVTLILQQNRVSLCLLEKNFPELPGLKSYVLDDSQIGLLRDHMVQAFISDDVAAVTKVAICLAMCIQQYPAELHVQLDPSTLPAPLEVLERTYMESAEAFLAPDEGIVGSMDGVECLLSQMRYYLKGGKPQKAWVIFRRAFTFAQLLGGTSRHFSSSNGGLDFRKKMLWLRMFQIDKSLSLLLGRPYVMSGLPFQSLGGHGASFALSPTAEFMYKLSVVSGRVIDRNSQDQKISDYSQSLQIDQDLEECRSIMPSTWWDAQADSTMSLEQIYDMFTIKFWYHHLRIYVHIPFVFRCSARSQYQTSTELAVMSSRQMIQCYEMLRNPNRPTVKLCNMLDFQVLIAALIVIVNLLGNGSPGNTYDVSLPQEEEDWDLIYHLLYTMTRAAQETPESVATQAVRLIRDLSNLRFGPTQSESNGVFHATVPYFGVIRLRRRTGPSGQNPGFGSLDQKNDSRHHVGLGSGQTAGFVDSELCIGNDDHLELPANQQPWLEMRSDWTPTIDFKLQDDWSWAFGDM